MKEYVAGPAFGQVHDLAEGPRWDDDRQSVSWVDIARGIVFRGSLDSDGMVLTDRLDFADTVGAASPTVDGGFVVAAHDRVVVVSADGVRRAFEPMIDREQHLRLNDAAVDPAGRLVVGSLATDRREGAAALFRVEADGSATVLREGMNLANGIGWSPEGATLYAVDSLPGVLWTASYDIDSGQPHAWAPLVTEFEGLPDGLSVDAEGMIWVALWNGGQVRCFAPSGEPVAALRLPVPHVTAVTFVGPSRDRLLITSSRDELDESARQRYPDSGRLFLADVESHGLPSNYFIPQPHHGTLEKS